MKYLHGRRLRAAAFVAALLVALPLVGMPTRGSARGELVGLIFDGNIQSLPGYFIYDAAVNRAVAVDVRGMTEALRKVYGAETLVNELLAAVAAPTAAQ